MFYKVQSVIPKENFILSVLFTDGVKKEYDVKPLFKKWPAFRDLQDIPGLYKQVKVDAGGYGISWNDEIDLEGNELREHGKECLHTISLNTWNEIEEEKPDEIDLAMLREIEEDPDCHEFISSEEALKELEL